MSAVASKAPPIYPPCDQCLHRKVRCDKTLPRCYRCSEASLPCTRDVVRRRPGRKRGSGAVISRLRDPAAPEQQQWHKSLTSSDESLNGDRKLDEPGKPDLGTQNGTDVFGIHRVSPNSSLNEGYFNIPSRDNRSVLPSLTPYSLQRGRSRSFDGQAIFSALPNLSRHIDLFFAKLYPIWPIIPETQFRASLSNPSTLDATQTCLILSICALTVLHIPGSTAPAPEPRKVVAQGFINQCRQLRSTFDYIESASITTIQTSLFLSCAEVEFQRARSSWFLLREAIMLVQELELYPLVTHSTPNLNPNEILSIRRTLYLLSLVERGLTVLRNKPFAIVMFDSPPAQRFEDEDPRILNGLQSLSRLFNLLDKPFLDTWVVASASSSSPPPSPNTASQARTSILSAQRRLASMRFETENLTDVQKADILVTQQWLRLVFWQSAMRQGLLSSSTEEEVLSYAFPCRVAGTLCVVLGEIAREAIFVHGMAIVRPLLSSSHA
jgi:hypothetical protein